MSTKTTTKKSGTIRPLGDRVLVERTEAEERTSGGILLPESAKEKPKEGKVVAAGEGKLTDEGKRTPLAVRVGDRILFSAYAGTEIKYGGDEYLIMREEDILAVIA